MTGRRARDSDYLLLGVSPSASPAELLSAFRRRARDVHPDIHPDDPRAHARFQDLSDAYRAAAERADLVRADVPRRTARSVQIRVEPPRSPAPQPPIRATPTVVRPPAKPRRGGS